MNKDKDGKEAYTPVETFNVEKGKRYRFRLIAGTVSCWFKVSVDNHKMNVIATDGEPVKPVSVDVIQIHPGMITEILIYTHRKKNTIERY